MSTNAQRIRAELEKLGDERRAKISQRFFKTGPGEYGEGDVFIGVRVPDLRKLAGRYQSVSEKDIRQLLKSPIHEERLVALLILVLQYNRSDDTGEAREAREASGASGVSGASRTDIYRLYLDNTRYINSWDLVDLTAPSIVGHFLSDRSRKPLYGLAKSPSLWDRRIAILATFYFVKQGDFEDTLAISKRLLNDKEDLIHKAVGWMLREVGKRDQRSEEKFLTTHYKTMPRTMLRYAIEKFPECRRQPYLKGTI